MFWVEYFCPCPGQAVKGWQRGSVPYPTFASACAIARILKPPTGQARVLDQYGREVFRYQ